MTKESKRGRAICEERGVARRFKGGFFSLPGKLIIINLIKNGSAGILMGN